MQARADWDYIVANLRLQANDEHALAPTTTRDFGGIQVGFVGAVTEDLPSLVSPAGIAELEVTDIVEEVNDAAADLVAGGADVVVMLVHEGAPNTDCDSMDDDPALGVRQHRHRGQSGRRRDRVRAHAPGLQLLVPRGRVGGGGPDRDRTTGGLRRAVRQQPEPAGVHRRRRHRRGARADPGDPAAAGPRPRRHGAQGGQAAVPRRPRRRDHRRRRRGGGQRARRR